ncbi:ABC transporter substrate-binding protein [Candidatus Colwellia aromaticivorans]|uniref:ABC transporter substrate-binding protein n=1 Tax=Candidatus Colwellia aromaticivorans TaxID=2267621 RepID=UPI000DF1EEAB|nr:ABC transporter substrate-binding protein [Candidatus Colwellia aromaticivorans]
MSVIFFMLLSSFLTSFSAFSIPVSIDITYLKLHKQHSPALSNIIKIASDSGYQGARLAIEDSNTTGKFLQQHFALTSFEFAKQQDLLARLKVEFSSGKTIFILDAPLPVLNEINLWAQNKNILLFNISEFSNNLRNNQCLNTILHTAPSHAMKSDALAQWLLYRRLNKVLLIRGEQPADIALAESFKRSAKRYGLKIISEKTWNFNTDLRRSAQQEIPLFTQTSKEYNVVYVADQTKDFAEYIPFNTYLPRPVVGSAGLEALSWHKVIEQWGAAQLQTRFNKLTNRHMNEIDFNGYLAVRSVAQAVHKTNSAVVKELTAYIKSDDFKLAAYKGRKLSFRSWNGQLRMPIALIQPHGLVSQSPQAGILHPITELDTLGFDQQESHCNAN